MPQWLMQEEETNKFYGEDSFIDKSILSIIKVLSKIRMSSVKKESKINSDIFLLTSFILIIFISTTRSINFLWVVLAYELFFLSIHEYDFIKSVLTGSIIAVIFATLIVLPSILAGYSNSFLIIIKVFLTVCLVNFTSYGYDFNNLTSSLKIFFVPDIFIFVLDTTLRYIFILGEFSLNILYALKLRSIGKNKDKSNSIASIVGILFIRGREMSEEMHLAMEKRGFDGTYLRKKSASLSIYDIIYIIMNICFVIIYFYFVRLG
ncbi:MAG: energy-coupling factor transporter transmembrane component T [Clostridiaceae bacterium]